MAVQNFNEQTLINQSFDGQNLNGSTFVKTKFEGGSLVNTRLRGTNFNEAELLGVNATGANFQPNNNFPTTNFAKAKLENSNFTNANFQGVQFSDGVESVEIIGGILLELTFKELIYLEARLRVSLSVTTPDLSWLTSVMSNLVLCQMAIPASKVLI